MTTLFDISGIRARIFTLPNRLPFMIAADLAEVYGTSVKRLGEAVGRNPERFPEDFMFTLTEGETEHLRSQNATANTISTKVRYAPTVFTHAGAYALSAVLKTPTAAQVSVIVHRAFAAMEKAAMDETRFMLTKLRTEAMRGRGLRVQVIEGCRAGYSFDHIWRMGRASRPRIEQALRESKALGLIDAFPSGMPAEAQRDLFADA